MGIEHEAQQCPFCQHKLAPTVTAEFGGLGVCQACAALLICDTECRLAEATTSIMVALQESADRRALDSKWDAPRAAAADRLP